MGKGLAAAAFSQSPEVYAGDFSLAAPAPDGLVRG